jgi:hypothetical protein
MLTFHENANDAIKGYGHASVDEERSWYKTSKAGKELRFYELLRGLVGRDVARATPATQEASMEEQLRNEAEKHSAELKRAIVKVVYESVVKESKPSLAAVAKPSLAGAKEERETALQRLEKAENAVQSNADDELAHEELREAKKAYDHLNAMSHHEWAVVDGEMMTKIRDLLGSEKGGTFFQSTLKVKNALEKLHGSRVRVDELVRTVVDSLNGTSLVTAVPRSASRATGFGTTGVILDERAVAAMDAVTEEVRKFVRSYQSDSHQTSVVKKLTDKHTSKFATAVACAYLHNDCRDAASNIDESASKPAARVASHAKLATTAQRARVALRVLLNACVRE